MTTNIFDFLKSQKKITIMLIITTTLWAIGLPMWISTASAADVVNFSDTLSDSDVNVVSNHTVEFTMSDTGSLVAGGTVELAFESFNVDAITADDVDMTVNGVHQNFATNWSVSTSSNTVIITSVSGTLASDDVVKVYIGTNATSTADTTGPGVNQIVNPGAGSYTVTLSGNANMTDSGTTRVVIIEDVSVTASVDTTFTFSIAGVSADFAAITGEATTSIQTTATSVPFGSLQASVPKQAAQQLTVTTNAVNGFSVTVQQDGNLESASTADIDVFVDGDATTTPLAWQSPAGTAGLENTYGHYGITSEDANLSSGDTFGDALYVGGFSASSPLEVFYHGGVALATTTYVGIKIEVSGLQEAASDYSNTLMYVATPVF